MIRAMVTGAGSGVGQAVLKALRMAEIDLVLIPADCNTLAAGLYRSKEALLIPRLEAEGAIDVFAEMIVDSGVDIVFPGSEFDVEALSSHRDLLEQATGAKIAVSNARSVALAGDKWLTNQRLDSKEIRVPRSTITTERRGLMAFAEKLGFPLIVKPRRGTSSRDKHVCHSVGELFSAVSVTPDPIVQEMIVGQSPDIGDEFTCAVFRTRSGNQVGPFVARRSLRGGSSWVIEVDRFDELTDYVIAVADALDFEGSLNVQLMVGPRGPATFEVNCRFSGTTAVRAHFGFNEPKFSVLDLLLGEPLEAPDIRRGSVVRYLEEVFINGSSLAELHSHFGEGEIRRWF